MTQSLEVKVPDIGDFSSVPVIEVLVGVGDHVEQEQSLVTLESDKATMEIPSPAAGEVLELRVEVGSEVEEGSVVLVLEPADQSTGQDGEPSAQESRQEPDEEPEKQTDDQSDQQKTAPSTETTSSESTAQSGKQSAATSGAADSANFDFDVVVIGSGPGGYTAAFRAADLGLKVALIERYPTLGGVCLNVGCIPSKAFLHTAAIIDEAAAMEQHGVRFGDPQIDLESLRSFKNNVVGKLTGGLAGMARKRQVKVIQGSGTFSSPNEISVRHNDEVSTITFSQAIIAAGSQSLELKGLPWGDPRLMDSTAALDIEEIPGSLLVIGGGIIGLEMACVYHALGSKVTVVELTGQLMPGADPDLVKPLQNRVKKKYENIHLNTRVTQVDVADDALVAHFDGENVPDKQEFDRVLVAVGRVPNGHKIGADAAGVEVDERGFIAVDNQQRTNVSHIFAIGDIVGQPMLAHKATHEGKVAAEVCAGEKSFFDARVIPSVAYTDPEVAWVGVTESEASGAGMEIESARFPMAASGRALGIDRTEGFTKLLFDKASGRIVGAGIVSPHAGDLIAECALAIEMGCDAADISLTIHPHPTLSESIGMAAEILEGTITDLYMPRKS